MAKKKNSLSTDIAEELMGSSKSTVRELEWKDKKSFSNPQWVEFQSACKVENVVREDVYFIATYRAQKQDFIGGFEIVQSEKFSAAIMIGQYRIYAIDVGDTPHTNKIGKDRPYYQHIIDSRTHEHIWCDQGYGYAEPHNDIDSIENLLHLFQTKANLVIIGDIVHPMKGIQPRLL